TWPGEPMTDSNGDGWYEYSLNATSAEIIFDCNGAPQSADLPINTDVCYQGAANTGMFVTCPDFDAPEVFIDPIGGNYTEGSITVSLSSENATAIYYTTDGSTPDNTSTPYTNPFPLNNSMGASGTVKAIAYNASTASDVKMETYTFSQQDDARPIILRWDPQGSCNTPFIYVWELDGVMGTENAPFPGEAMTDEDGDGWYEYTVDAASTNVIFSCGSNQNQTADLFAEGHACFQGNVGNGNWISCPDFSDPSVAINPNGGMYAGESNVAVTLPSAEASSVYYTLDGSTPDVMSTPYTGVFNVTGLDETITVKAIAYSNTNSSTVVSADFIFDDMVSCPDSIGVHGMIGGGTYRAANKITSTATINTGNVIFEAGSSITLQEGFHADPATGTDQFTARIQSCVNANNEIVEERQEIVINQKVQLQVFPNPLSESANIRYFMPTESQGRIHLLDINGQIIQSRNLPLVTGWQEYILDAQNLVPGIYFLNLNTSTTSLTHKIIVID
ncbi:MAG: FN3 associated domain-containing protein, partial [Bacteroidota bacterium]